MGAAGCAEYPNLGALACFVLPGAVFAYGFAGVFEMLSVRQAAEIVGVTGETVRGWIASGLLPARRVGPRLLRIRPEDLEDFLRPKAQAAK